MNSSLPGKEIIANGCPFYEAMGGRLHQPSTLTQAFLIIITVVHILTFPITAALNALVMFAVKMNSRLRAHKSNIGLALLALTDFFVGVLAQPAFIALIITLLVDDDSSSSCTLPNFTIAVSRIGVPVSLVHTVLISGEGYLAVRHSFAYLSLVTEARFLVATVLAWLLSITLHIPLAVYESVFLPIKNTLYGLCVVLIIFCHLTVYLEIRRHQKQIAAQQVTVEAREQFQKDKKAFKVTFIVIVVDVGFFSHSYLYRSPSKISRKIIFGGIAYILLFGHIDGVLKLFLQSSYLYFQAKRVSRSFNWLNF